MISHAVSNVAPILWSSGTGHPAGPHAPASKQPKRVALQNGKFGAQQHDNASAGQTLARMIALGFRLDHRMVQTTKNMMPLPVWLQNKWLLRNAKIQVNFSSKFWRFMLFFIFILDKNLKFIKRVIQLILTLFKYLLNCYLILIIGRIVWLFYRIFIFWYWHESYWILWLWRQSFKSKRESCWGYRLLHLVCNIISCWLYTSAI